MNYIKRRIKEFKNSDIKLYKESKKQIKETGFCNEDMWNLNLHLAQLIYPRLKKFKEEECDYPASLSGIEEWHEILDCMIDAFEILQYNVIITEEKREIINKGLLLFAKYYTHLWY